VRWSYISGVLVLLGLFVGLAKSMLDRTFFFSASAYNLTTATALLAASGCIYFSLRSYLECPPVGRIKSAIGIGCLLAVSALAVWQVSANETAIQSTHLKWVIGGMQARTGAIDSLDDKIKALMNEGDIASLAAAIVVNDDMLWIQGYGEQPDLDRLYDIGSVTKPVVASAVFQLYERGQIGLDEDVNAYLPFKVRHPNYPELPITVRMLLANRSCLAHNTGLYLSFLAGAALRQWGVKNRGWAYGQEFGQEFETLAYAEFMDGYLDPGGPYYHTENWASCRPGTAFVYSTPGYDLLGYLVERVSGQAFDAYLQENIFDPLGMRNATATPLDDPDQIAIPYERWYGVLAKRNVPLPLSQRRRIGGGGLYTTAEDLAKFLLVHMNQGKVDGQQLLQPETVALMHRSQSETSGDFMQVGYGCGWSRFQKDPWQVWDLILQPRGFEGHGGRTWGYSSAMYMVQEREGAYGYVLLINTSMVESMDTPWYFAIQANLQDVILGEAYRMYQTATDQ
jgi:CubicO group peptidase (beta-lactamase class C family)